MEKGRCPTFCVFSSPPPNFFPASSLLNRVYTWLKGGVSKKSYHLALSHCRLLYGKCSQESRFSWWREGHMLLLLFFFQVEEDLLNFQSYLIMIHSHFWFPTFILPKLRCHSMLYDNILLPHHSWNTNTYCPFYNKLGNAV